MTGLTCNHLWISPLSNSSTMAILSTQRRKPANAQKSPRPFNIAFTNIRGLRSNFTDVESFLHSSSPDILALCETNLNSSIPSSDFLVPGYLPLFRKDSECHMHGLGLYARESIPLARQPDLEDCREPFMCFRLSLLHSTSYLFFLYRAPSSQNCSVLDAVSDSIDKALSLHSSANVFVFGDFNVQHRDWLKFSNGTNAAGVSSYNFAIAQSLTQLVDFPTRFSDRQDGNHSSSLLDLFLTSIPDRCKVNQHSPLGTSDHAVICASADLISTDSHESPTHRTLFSYSRGNWDAFRDFLRDAPWSDICKRNADEFALELTSWISAGIDAFIPSRKFQVKPHSSPWFSPACAAAIAHRNHFFHLYQQHPSPGNRKLFVTARNQCKYIIRDAKAAYQERIRTRISAQRVGSREFWRIMKSVRSNGKLSIAPLFNGPEVLTSSVDKSSLFAKLFSSNSTLDDSGHELPEFTPRTDVTIESCPITASQVASVISQLDSSKATGPDGIPVIVFQKCSPELSPILSKLFNKCLQEHSFPSCWKMSSVVPIFKNSGERSDARNYRPISLLPIMSKIFECLLNNTLVKHIESLGLLSDHQYGFRGGRSTADLLAVVTERVFRALNVSGEARLVALDISKAFDKVWHAGLLQKLRGYGISGSLLGVISSFLSNRKLQVVLDGHTSDSFFINAGVPQGSLLGPTLFLLYINDLPDHILSKIAIYADDSSLFSCSEGRLQPDAQLQMAADLSSDLRSVVEWGAKWLVSFNSTKTKLLSLNRYRTPFLPTVFMGNDNLSESDSLRLLGMTLSQDLSWKNYIIAIAKSAAMKVGSLIRSRKFLSRESILYLYKSTIRPSMEYCCHLWSGAPAIYLGLLDRIQHRICVIIGEELSSKLDSLEHRRNVASLSLFYKYFHGHCSRDLSDLVPSVKSFARSTRLASASHPFTVEIPHGKVFYSRSFFPRTATLWNSLPNSCFPPTYNLQAFKTNVHRHLLSSHL